jgi:hypothetical protein
MNKTFIMATAVLGLGTASVAMAGSQDNGAWYWNPNPDDVYTQYFSLLDQEFVCTPNWYANGNPFCSESVGHERKVSAAYMVSIGSWSWY